MPNKPLHPCAYPSCPALIPAGERFCTDHKRQLDREYNRQRGSAASQGYGARWRKLRTWFLKDHPLCAICGRPATDVDHIVSKRKGGTDDPENLQALCHACHSAKTAKQDRRFGLRLSNPHN